MLRKIRRYLDERKSRIDLPADTVREVIERHRAGEWFFYAFSGRAGRWYVCEPSLWVARNLPRRSAIFETGCGCGLNLIWFSQKGYRNLKGSDLCAAAIGAGEELARLAHAPVELWQDDALAPVRLPEKADLLLALNWTYHVEGFDLGAFLVRYAAVLTDRGHLIVDVIDTSYDRAVNNQYLSSDWNKPVAERAPTEYKKRYSPLEVQAFAAGAGFEIRHTIRRDHEIIPRVVYILRKH
ncbi:class I SAM-dependent methyltransferase [Geomonas subterranea]|uniref:Methyltransferase domain-containing protein n=1 Tax=Geomonas subterranea TaxID=2847989 RepID=A0ABX8LJW8_9BACT|nr:MULTISPECIES: class I SAM-dependent methyltransferase [Geomonas]QXE92330.1 methyltransferase domain-containing protein [Geomonas subterranea]QXM09571.1 methyltransferase domain-containing protein [Geomonas subterranea]